VERHFTFVSGKTEQYHIEKIPRSSVVSAARFTLEDKNKHTMLLHFCIDIFWSRPCSYYGIWIRESFSSLCQSFTLTKTVEYWVTLTAVDAMVRYNIH